MHMTCTVFQNVPPLIAIVLYCVYLPESWHPRSRVRKGIACVFSKLQAFFCRGHFSIITSKRTLSTLPYIPGHRHAQCTTLCKDEALYFVCQIISTIPETGVLAPLRLVSPSLRHHLVVHPSLFPVHHTLVKNTAML